MERERPLQSIPDDELLRRLADLLRQSRHNEADLVAHIGEVDERRLYAREASPSMFAYCTEVLHLSEAEAYLRIAAARAARVHPVLLTMLRDGRLHLTGIAKLAPHLTPENASTLLSRATHRSKRQILELLAEVAPRPDVPTAMRRLPERRRLAPCTPRSRRASAATREPRPLVERRTDSGYPESRRPEQTRPSSNSVQTKSLESSGPSAERGGASGPRAIQGPVHGQRRVPRQAGSPPGPDALAGSRRRSGHDPRAAVTEKLERLEAKRFAQAKTPRKSAPGRQDRSRFASHSRPQ